MYSFNFKITHKDLFDSSMNFNKSKFRFIFNLLFTFAFIALLVYSIYTKTFHLYDNLRKVLMIICVFLFPVIQPLMIYLKLYDRANKLNDVDINMTFNDDEVLVSSKFETATIKYENIYNVFKYKNMIVIMYDSIHGQIMPDRIFNNNKEEFYYYLSKHILEARKIKNENPTQ